MINIIKNLADFLQNIFKLGPCALIQTFSSNKSPTDEQRMDLIAVLDTICWKKKKKKTTHTNISLRQPWIMIALYKIIWQQSMSLADG